MEQTPTKEPSPVLFGILTAIGITLLFQFGTAIGMLRVGEAMPLPWIVASAQLLTMLAPTLYVARAQNLPARELFRFRRADLRVHLAVVVGIVALWPILQAWLVAQELYMIPDGALDAYRSMQRTADDMYQRLFPVGGMLAPLTALICGAVIPGFSEEILFRGATQRSLERRMRPWVAIAITALLFGVVHLQPVNAVPLIVMGLFLGLAAWAGGSIYPAVVGHFLFNASMIGALYTLRASGGEIGGVHSETELYDLLPYAAVALVPLFFVVRWLVKSGNARS